MKEKTKAPVDLDQDAAEQHRLGLDRVIFFSDAVFAIAITVLVLEIRVPEGVDTADAQQLLILLGELWHKYLAYFISFWVIGLYWLSHHRKFLLIKRFDYRLLTLNLLLLMVIAFIPFPTAILSESSNRTATIFYALVMAAGGLVTAALWWHAARNHRLIDPHISRKRQWQEVTAPLVTAGVFLISIGLAFLGGGLVRLFWALILPVAFISSRRQYAR